MSRMLDLSGGLRGGISDYGAKPNHVVVAENVEFRPFRAVRVRKGSQRASSDTLHYEPHTALEWVGSSTTSNKYVACKDAVNGRMYRMASGSFTPQTLPNPLQPSTWLSHCQLNGALFATENSGTLHPFFYRSSNAADTWLDCIYPTPAASLTLTPGAASGSMAPSLYYSYRLRHIFADGSSVASASQEVLLGAGDDSVAVSTIPLAPAGRTDWVGWILERTIGYAVSGGLASGPFYYAGEGTSTPYTDKKADADLGYQSDDNWFTGIPGGHLDGLIAMPDRLAGWIGSTLYVSQPIGDPSSAGILNFNAKNGYDFGKDDGDRITCVWQQQDRYIVHKEHSTWALEGTDPSNFTVVRLASVGAAGLRAASGMGGMGWFYGAAGLHRIAGNEIAPWGYVEVGDIVELFSPARAAEVVVKNHLGQRVLVGFSNNLSYNDTLLVHDLRFKTWEVWRGWYPRDILVPKVADFGDAEAILIADPRDFAPTGSHDYRIWIANYGTKDERNSAGGEGSPISVKLRTPWIDDGMPDVEKALEWLQVYGGGSGVTITAIVETDPATRSDTLQLVVPDTGAKWGSFVWGDGTKWGSSPTEAASEQGILLGLKGRRYRITFLANCTGSFFFKGYALSTIFQPGRRYSK